MSLTPPADGATKRDWLAANGLAKANSRGRFSNAAMTALDTATANGWTFAEPIVEVKVPAAPKAAPKVDKPKVANPNPATAQASFDAKTVRAWAVANKVPVGDRGRIHPNVIAAFVQANGALPARPAVIVAQARKASEVPAVRRPTPLDMPKRRPETSGFTRTGGILVRQDTCGSCAVSVSRCACNSGPQAYSYVGGGTLLLDKPTV